LIATRHHRGNEIRSVVWCSVVNGPTIDLMTGSAKPGDELVASLI
jgi:hypothetical protein